MGRLIPLRPAAGSEAAIPFPPGSRSFPVTITEGGLPLQFSSITLIYILIRIKRKWNINFTISKTGRQTFVSWAFLKFVKLKWQQGVWCDLTNFSNLKIILFLVKRIKSKSNKTGRANLHQLSSLDVFIKLKILWNQSEWCLRWFDDFFLPQNLIYILKHE